MRQHSERPTEEETIPNRTVSLSPRFGMVLPLARPDQLSERTPGQRPGASTQLPALAASRPKAVGILLAGYCRVDGQRGSVTRPFLSVPPRTRTCCFYS